MRKNLFLIAIAVFLSSLVANAEFSFKLTDDITLRLGGEFRLRYEGYSSSVVFPDVPRSRLHNTEYFRVRTRLDSTLDFGEDITVNFSLANRFHYVTTSMSDPNNNGASTWEFPDEVYIHTANIVFKNLLDGALTITLGRQDIGFGNGMIVAEGTPYDQGRSVYFDGVSARFSTEQDTVTAFVFYDDWKDRTVFINDRNRALREGDIFTAGVYATHNFSEPLNVDAYYVFNNVELHGVDASYSLHTAGARVFGSAIGFDYGLEAARQFGRDANDDELAGTMLDARLKYHLLQESDVDPTIGVEFTHLSGDDAGKGRNRAWNPLLSQCPLWGEELLPTMLRGGWTNLNMVGGTLTCNVTEQGKVMLYATDYQADESSAAVSTQAPTGDGRHFGLLVGGMAAYKFAAVKGLAAQVYLSHFMPGDFFSNGHDSNWFRLELTYAF